MLKRLGQILRRSIAAIIMVAWLALIVLWIRSYWRGDAIIRDWIGTDASLSPPLGSLTRLVIISGDGGLCLGFRYFDPIRANGQWPIRQWMELKKPEYPTPTLWSMPHMRGGRQTINIGKSASNSNQSPTPQPLAIFQFGSPLRYMEPLAVPSDTFEPQIFLAGPRQFFAYSVHQPAQQFPAGPSDDATYAMIFPYWSAIIILSIPVLFQIMRMWRWVKGRRRFREGLCANCGYDLRATPDRCPECGAIPATPIRETQNA